MSGRRAVWAAFIGLIALTGGSAFARAPVRPDLAETAILLSQHGRTLRVTDVVRNVGSVAAPRSTTGYYVASLRVGGRTVPRLSPRGVSRVSTTLTLPGSIAPGSYRLLACADDRRQLRESDERNNCRAASVPLVVADGTPPTFAGLVRATTCIPGPVGGRARLSVYSLGWSAATDDDTPQSEIAYDIYQANAPGREDFSRPTYTAVGTTSFTTPLLPDDSAYYFVVRARDKEGNRDGNTVERLGTNICL